MSMDKRRKQREKSFIVAYLDDVKVYITDISQTGCQVFIEKEIDLVVDEKKVVLKIELPKYKDEKIYYSMINGIVMWEKKLDDFNILGVNFDDLNNKDNLDLSKIVNYWNFLNSTFGNYSVDL